MLHLLTTMNQNVKRVIHQPAHAVVRRSNNGNATSGGNDSGIINALTEEF